MSIDPDIQGVKPVGAAPAKADAAATAEGGVLFRALMEKIEENARALDEASASLEGPRQLGEAVSSARESVEQAVLLGSDLLEAYRAAQQRAAAETSTDASGPQDPNTGSGGGR